MSSSYEVLATRSGDWWHVELSGFDRVYTQVKRLSDAAPMIVEVLELVHDTRIDASDVIVRLAEDELATAIDGWRDAVDESNRASQRAATAASDLARQLVEDQGLTQSDAAVVMGLSKQRVSQLINGPDGFRHAG